MHMFVWKALVREIKCTVSSLRRSFEISNALFQVRSICSRFQTLVYKEPCHKTLTLQLAVTNVLFHPVKLVFALASLTLNSLIFTKERLYLKCVKELGLNRQSSHLHFLNQSTHGSFQDKPQQQHSLPHLLGHGSWMQGGRLRT